ncbi:MAG TPA: hypothetical protein VK644_14630 [Chitinophagaceae bacterium]|nr:hypothetical protein [Chitinophagaceae bacterium]
MRMIIIGNGGTGKAVLGERMGNDLRIPVFHLDLITWKKDHRRVAEPVFRQRMLELMKNQDLILEGWGFQSTIRERLKWAQAIVYLCFPLEICLRTMAARNLEYSYKKYPYDVFEGDRLSKGDLYINTLTRIHNEYEPEVQVWLKEMENKKLIYTFYSKEDLDASYDNMLRRLRPGG